MTLPLPAKVRATFTLINRVVKDIILRRIDDRYIIGVDTRETQNHNVPCLNYFYQNMNQSS